VECVNIRNRFDGYISYKYNALLVDEFVVAEDNRQSYENEWSYVYINGNGELICQRPVMYIFLSKPVEEWRNTFVSQIMFPTILDYAEKYIDSPSYEIANHPFLYINYIYGGVTASSIIFPIVCLCVAGMQYVDTFEESLDIKDIPNDFKELIEKYDDGFAEKYDEATNCYSTSYYDIYFETKRVEWKTNKIITDLTSNTDANGVTTVDFNGSDEKFHWINLFTISVVAWKKGFEIDYSAYETFINAYEPQFKTTSIKMKRCKVLLDYMKKYFI
jgi:ribosomal protein S17E